MADLEQSAGVKMLATFFAGIILTGLGAFIVYPHNLPTKDDLTASQNLTEKEIVDLQTQLALAQSTLAAVQDQTTKTRIQVGKISYKLNIPDSQ